MNNPFQPEEKLDTEHMPEVREKVRHMSVEPKNRPFGFTLCGIPNREFVWDEAVYTDTIEHTGLHDHCSICREKYFALPHGSRKRDA